MGLGVGVNYYFDFEQFSSPVYLHLTADILKRDMQFLLKFGVEF